MSSSPVSVFDFPTSMYPIRFIVFAYPDRGMVAFDLMETMNRIEYFRARGSYDHFSATENIKTLTKIRFGEIMATQARFYGSKRVPWVQTPKYGGEWFKKHGIEVDMMHYDEQEISDRDMIAALEAVERGIANAVPIVGLDEVPVPVGNVIPVGLDALRAFDAAEAMVRLQEDANVHELVAVESDSD